MLTFLGASLRPWAPERISLPSGTIAIIEKLRMRKLTSHDVFFLLYPFFFPSTSPATSVGAGEGEEDKCLKKKKGKVFSPCLTHSYLFLPTRRAIARALLPTATHFLFLVHFPGNRACPALPTPVPSGAARRPSGRQRAVTSRRVLSSRLKRTVPSSERDG